MQYTSAEANKILKKLQEEKERIVNEEVQCCVFVAATIEDPNDVRPDYRFLETQDRIADVDAKIRKVKHAINLFNTTTIVDGFTVTIDEMLVMIPQLSARKSYLAQLARRLPKTRKQSRYGEKSNFIEYEYANYNVSEAKDMYEKISDVLSKAQIALDKVNNSERFEIDI